MRHYKQLEQAIRMYFQKNSIEIDIEPHGSRGPDIKGHRTDNKLVIGEIKSKTEILRDLSGYWGQWNSDRAFGGKTNDYKLRREYLDKGEGLPYSGLKGWAAVMDGQLRGYCKKERIREGVLIVESFDTFKDDILCAIVYLCSQDRLAGWSVETDAHEIGYVTLNYV